MESRSAKITTGLEQPAPGSGSKVYRLDSPEYSYQMGNGAIRLLAIKPDYQERFKGKFIIYEYNPDPWKSDTIYVKSIDDLRQLRNLIDALIENEGKPREQSKNRFADLE